MILGCTHSGRTPPKQPEDAPTSLHIACAKDLGKQYGVTADDAPTHDPQSTDADVEVCKAKARAWNEEVREFTDGIIDTLDDLGVQSGHLMARGVDESFRL